MPPYTPVAFDHLVLRISDVERSLRFYQDVVGCAVDWARPDLGLYHLRVGDSLIDLVDITGPLGGDGVSVPEGAPRNLDHFCLIVDPFEEAAIREFLGSHGIEASSAAERYGARGNALSIYFHDPDGNQIEFKAPGPVSD